MKVPTNVNCEAENATIDMVIHIKRKDTGLTDSYRIHGPAHAAVADKIEGEVK